MFVGFVFFHTDDSPFGSFIHITTLLICVGFFAGGLAFVIGGGSGIGESLPVTELWMLYTKRPNEYAARVREIGEAPHARGGMEKMI